MITETGTSGGAKAPPAAIPPVVSAARRGIPAAWIREVDGFRVDGPDGRIGTAVRIVRAPGSGISDELEVAVGLFIVRIVHIPVDDVVDVQPARRRLTVRSLPCARRRAPHELKAGVRRFLRSAGRAPRR
jgi:hypothetical protein